MPFMGIHSAKNSRRRPDFDSLEARSLLNGDPLGVTPSVNIATVAARVGRIVPGPGAIFTGSDAVATRAELASHVVAGPQWGFSAFASSQWFGPPIWGHGPAEEPEAFGPAIQEFDFAHAAPASPFAGYFMDHPGGSAPDQPADEFQTVADVWIALRIDVGLGAGYSPGAALFAAPAIVLPTRGKPQTVETNAGIAAGLVGLDPSSGTGAQVAVITSGKGAEVAPIAGASTAIPTAASLPPLHLVSIISNDVGLGIVPGTEAAAPALADRPSGPRGLGAPRAAAGKSLLLGGSGTSLSRESLTARFAGDEPRGLPGPMGDDLIANILPFQRASIERAVDRFFNQLSDVELREFVAANPAQIVFFSVTLTSTVIALEFARRWRQRSLVAAGGRVRDSRESRDQVGFPELPGSWSSRLT
jgi:hypothetical protein